MREIDNNFESHSKDQLLEKLENTTAMAPRLIGHHSRKSEEKCNVLTKKRGKSTKLEKEDKATNLEIIDDLIICTAKRLQQQFVLCSSGRDHRRTTLLVGTLKILLKNVEQIDRQFHQPTVSALKSPIKPTVTSPPILNHSSMRLAGGYLLDKLAAVTHKLTFTSKQTVAPANSTTMSTRKLKAQYMKSQCKSLPNGYQTTVTQGVPVEERRQPRRPLSYPPGLAAAKRSDSPRPFRRSSSASTEGAKVKVYRHKATGKVSHMIVWTDEKPLTKVQQVKLERLRNDIMHKENVSVPILTL